MEAQFSSEESARIQQWCREDPCFDALNALRLAAYLGLPEVFESAKAGFERHFADCGACWENLLVEAESTSEPFKRQTYINLTLLTQFELMHHLGGAYEVLSSPEVAHHIRVVFPYDAGDPWTAIELYLGKRSGDRWLSLDLWREEDFKEPTRVLRRLDLLCARHVRTYRREGGEAISWWSVISDAPVKVSVRWEGNVKEIAKGAALHDRYASLAGQSVEAADKSNEVGLGNDPGAEVLRLREVAAEYDETSPFESYAKTRFTQRGIDGYRRANRDAAHGDYRVSPQDCGTRVDGSTTEPSDALMRYGIDRRLNPRERQVLDRKLAGATDSQIAKELGVSRETVNRDRAKIRKKVGPYLGRPE